MDRPQRRFGKDFEVEAVHLVETSGRTQREIAEDLGVGLSTLRRWLVSTTPSGAIRRLASKARFSSRVRPRKIEIALQNLGASPMRKVSIGSDILID